MAKLIGNFTLICILQKIYMSILALLNMYSMFYCISIYDKEEKLNKLKKVYLLCNKVLMQYRQYREFMLQFYC